MQINNSDMGRVSLLVILTSLATLLSSVLADPAFHQDTVGLPVINVPLTIRYVTTEIMTAHEKETMVLAGTFCQHAKGKAINVTMLLNNNPQWDPTFGVVRYFVVDDINKGNSSALCSNVVNGVAGPNCVIASWPSDKDIYVKATAGQSEAISFTLDAEVFANTSKEAAYIQAFVSKRSIEPFRTPNVSKTLIYLTEIVTTTTEGELAYHQSALLNFTFCPTPSTGSQYIVRTVITGTDGHSSYAQYLCDKLPCVVDGPNVVANNGRQLPSNTVTTTSGRWSNLYALVVCWGGVYDPSKEEYYGHFVFQAVQIN